MSDKTSVFSLPIKRVKFNQRTTKKLPLNIKMPHAVAAAFRFLL